MWPGPRPFWFLHADGRPPRYINAPWWYVLGAEQWAEDLSRQAWLDEVRQRLRLVTRL